ncbi:MAG: DoxX family protein [Terriglobia bacterium]
MADNARGIFRYLTGAFFVCTGALHLVLPATYLKIVPPYIPAPLAMVYISGVAEMLGGIGLCIRALQRAAGWWLVAVLIAIFPANLYMAMEKIQFTERPLPTILLWGRLPLQALLIWWVLEASRQKGPRRP